MNEPNDPLNSQALDWLRARGREPDRVTPMAGDVSARRYFRMEGFGEVLAHYPPDLLRSYECFLRTDELLLRAGVPTPQVLLVDPSRQWMVIEDVGTRQLSTQPDDDATQASIIDAFELAQRIARLDPTLVADLSPALETELLTREVRRTCRSFFRPQLGERESSNIERLLFQLCEELGQGTLVPAHRDYMARNLMLRAPSGDSSLDGTEETRLVVLDHQDLRLAPWGYDIASLLFDSCPLSEARSEQLAGEWLRTESDRTAVARCAVQRCIKIVGTFVGFARRGQTRYLPMVPFALRRAARELRLLPEASEDVARLLEASASEIRSQAQRNATDSDEEQVV